jgi:hypothetical protein
VFCTRLIKASVDQHLRRCLFELDCILKLSLPDPRSMT